MTIGSAAAVLYAIAASAGAEAGAHDPLNGVVRCSPDNQDVPSHFDCSCAGGTLILQSYGSGELANRAGRHVGFTVRLPPEGSIEGVSCAEFEYDPVLLFTVAVGDGAAGEAVRVDARTGRIRWQAHVPGFNVGEPLLYGRDMFVTAIDFVGRLSLDTGAWRWEHKLERALRFNSFRRPRLEQGPVVVFQEHNVYRRGKLKERELLVDAETGTILSGAVPDSR